MCWDKDGAPGGFQVIWEIVGLRLLNLLDTLVIWSLALGLLILFDKVTWKTVSLPGGLKQGNLAIAVFFGLVFLGLMLRTSLR